MSIKLADKQYDVFEIPIFQIWLDEDFNCRYGIPKESVEELASTIDKEGLLFPVDVQPANEIENIPDGFRWRLVCGYRRVTAVKLLGWETIPCRIREGLTERQAALMNFTENLERKDLNTLEEALVLDRLFPTYRTIRSIAKELSKPEGWVQVRRHLVCLSPWIQKTVAAGRLSDRDLQTIQHAPDPDVKAKEILRAAKEGRKYKVLYNGKTVRKKTEVQALITKMVEEGFHPALLRFVGWTIGTVDDKGLEEALTWLRDRKQWLK